MRWDVEEPWEPREPWQGAPEEAAAEGVSLEDVETAAGAALAELLAGTGRVIPETPARELLRGRDLSRFSQARQRIATYWPRVCACGTEFRGPTRLTTRCQTCRTTPATPRPERRRGRP